MPSSADLCVQWVIAEARRRRPHLRLVPERHLDRVIRHLYWHWKASRDVTRASLEQHAREWLARRQGIPWWALLLIKIAVHILIQLIWHWTTGNAK